MSGFRFSCLALCLVGGAAFADPLNIVVIVADNQSAEAIGAYGNRDVATPHIDRLAHDGIRFDRAYAASGMCSPTRATLLTGLMPSQHGLHDALHDAWVEQQHAGWSAIAEFRTLPLTLANRGYQTAMIGKWHIGDPTHPSLGFQHWVALPYGHTLDFWDNELVVNGQRQPVKDRHIVDAMANDEINLVFNTTEGVQSIADSYGLRRTALTQRIPYYTTVAGARAALLAIEAMSAGGLEVAPLQSYFRASF